MSANSDTTLERSMRSIFVGNIPNEASEEKLKELFSEFGPIINLRFLKDNSSIYAFCEYGEQEMALRAVRNLSNYDLKGRPLKADLASSEKSKHELQNLQASTSEPTEIIQPTEVTSEKAPEEISKAVASLPAEQMFELMKQMKMCIENNPQEARNLLLQNPQLAFALLQAQVIMRIVDPEVALKILDRPTVTATSEQEAKPNVETSQPVGLPASTALEPADVNAMGDQDLRHLPTSDQDMRSVISMGMADKDLRVITGDPDLRAMGGLMDKRPFDPRFRSNDPRAGPGAEPRGMSGADPRGMSGADPRGMSGSDPRGPGMPGVDPRGISNLDPRGMPISDPRGIPGVDPRGTPGVDPRGVPVSDPRGITGIDPRGIAGLDMRSAPGADPRIMSGANTRVIACADPRGMVGTDPRGIVGTDPRGIAVTDPRGIPAADPRGIPVTDPRVMPSADPRMITGDPRMTPVVDPRMVSTDPRMIPGTDPRVITGPDPRIMQGMDPRIIPGSDPRSMAGGVTGSPFGPHPVSDPRIGFEGRGIPPTSRVEDPRKPPTAAGAPMSALRMPANVRTPPVNAPPQSGPSNPMMGIRQPLQPATGGSASAPEDEEKAALIMQVLQLSDEQIAMLPPEQRQSIIVLKEQIARSHLSL